MELTDDPRDEVHIICSRQANKINHKRLREDDRQCFLIYCMWF